MRRGSSCRSSGRNSCGRLWLGADNRGGDQCAEHQRKDLLGHSQVTLTALEETESGDGIARLHRTICRCNARRSLVQGDWTHRAGNAHRVILPCHASGIRNHPWQDLDRSAAGKVCRNSSRPPEGRAWGSARRFRRGMPNPDGRAGLTCDATAPTRLWRRRD